MNKQTWTPRLGRGVRAKLLHTKEKGKLSFIVESQRKVFLKTDALGEGKRSGKVAMSDPPSPQTVSKTVPGFPGGAVVENLPANAGDTGSSPGLGRSHLPRSN